MNKIYKVIWNATLGTWVAVSELAKGKTKSSKITGIVGAATVSLMVTFSPDVFAVYEAGGGISNHNGGFGINTGIAIGNGPSGSATVGTNGAEAIAIGATTRANGSQSTVIGNDITGNGDQSVIIGSNFNSNMTTSTGKGGVAIGSGLTTTLKSPMANGIGSVAIGSSGDGTTNNLNGAVATGNHALALMAGSNANAVNSIAIGAGANASVANSVALGSNAVTSAYAQATGTINGKASAFAASGTGLNVVSVGAAGTERQIQNVAAGRITSTSTDAINGSQLAATNAVLGQVTTDTAAALGTTVNTTTGGITAPSYTVTTDPNASTTTTVNNVGAALAGLDTAVNKAITFTGTTGTTSQKLGSTVAVIGDSKNISTAVTANQIKVSISDNPSFTSVTTGNTVINTSGITTPQAVIGTGANTTTLTSTANGLN
ncbi:ESPR-type extended signal peptide-containing protein, partial [Acinetobacter piscicola]|uniref:ESPR-type extended signal peptide-containing protein n=1 Tax=Acinetobacter piscicola TaxID=2006115 RepID=UPI001BC877F1